MAAGLGKGAASWPQYVCGSMEDLERAHTPGSKPQTAAHVKQPCLAHVTQGGRGAVAACERCAGPMGGTVSIAGLLASSAMGDMLWSAAARMERRQ